MELDAEQPNDSDWFEFTEPDVPMTWVAPPRWPPAPRAWHPPAAWVPDPQWPAPPPGWQFWQKDPVIVEGARTQWWDQIVQDSSERISAPEFVFWELRGLEEQVLTTAVTTARVLEVDAWATQVDAVLRWDAPERRAVLAAQKHHLQALADQRSFLTRTTAGLEHGDAYARVRFASAHAYNGVPKAIAKLIRAEADLYRAGGGPNPKHHVPGGSRIAACTATATSHGVASRSSGLLVSRTTIGCVMKTMPYSPSGARFAETLNVVVDDREEVVITRAGHDPVVIVSLADYESLKATVRHW